MIKPVLQGEAFLEDLRQARSETDFFLWWLGQSGFLIKWRESFVLLDPYLSDSLTKKYAATDKPHVRMTELVIFPGALNSVNVVTSSHNHTDHLDADTLIPLLRVNGQTISMIIPEANREFVANRIQCEPGFPIGLDAGQSATIAGFTFHAIPGAHEKIDRDPVGRCHYLGYVIQFGPWTLYHSGDTIRHDAILAALETFSIDVALLPINGAAPERRVAGNLDGPQAATLAHDIAARLVIPCHYDMFQFNSAAPDAFIQTCQTLGQRYHLLRAGERWSSGEF